MIASTGEERELPSDTIGVAIDSGQVIVTLNRPKMFNAFNEIMLQALAYDPRKFHVRGPRRGADGVPGKAGTEVRGPLSECMCNRSQIVGVDCRG